MKFPQFILLIACLAGLQFPLLLNAQQPIVVIGKDSIPVVSQDVFTKYQEATQKKLDSLKKEIDNGKTALEISERYSEKANNLVSLYLGLLGGILALSGLILGFFLKWLVDKKTESLERELQDRIQESIETFRRITSTEKESIFIKKNAEVLAISGKNADPDLLAIQSALTNFRTEELTISHLSELLNNRVFRAFTESDAPLKVMLVGDELFSETYNGKAGSGGLEGLDKAEKQLFSIVKSREIGVVNFGRLKIPRKIHYQAFSNSPYSAYNNLNSLLKYMLATKDIEI